VMSAGSGMIVEATPARTTRTTRTTRSTTAA
jgi:hypothetical protein